MIKSSLFHPDFSPTPYWWEAYRPDFGSLTDVPKTAPVAIIGGGYAGLSCALELSRLGIQAVVLEANELGSGASTRSGGAVSGGLHVGKTAKKKGLSDKNRAKDVAASAEQAFFFLDHLIERENIQCHWEKRGRFVGAWTPEDHAIQVKRVQELQDSGKTGFRLVSRAEQREEIASDFYYGGLIAEQSGKLHPAMYYKGLLDAALKAGVIVCARAEVTDIHNLNNGWCLTTSRGSVEAEDVVIATNGYTGKITPNLRRRIIPVSSHIIATEPLPPALVESLLPRDRTVAETQRVLCYYRISPDRSRLIFGGRARFTPTSTTTIASILHGFMTERFPQLAQARVTNCWSGNVALTFDGLPHTGVLDGMHYALGCNGSGIATMTLLGARTARRIAGQAFDIFGFELPEFPTVPLYRGDPSLVLPVVGTYYRMRDRISRASAVRAQ